MFCTQCGSRNASEAKFCTSCGSPLAAVPGDVTVAEAPSPQDLGQDGGAVPPVPLPGGGTLPAVRPVFQSESQPAPQPGPAGSGAPSGKEGNDAGACAKALNRNLVIGIAVAAVVLVAAVAAGIVTYSMELWGGRSLPDVTVASPKDSSRAADAKVVVRQLEGKGFKVKRVKEFSGLGKGKFLGYKGVDSGARVRSGSTVVVRESLGPGVPDGTVGRKAERVVKTFSDMGVPVHYKKVLVSDSSKTPEGSVVSTYPVQGQPVKDSKNGIYIGVAAKGDGGLPSDIVGQNVSDVKSELESKGYTVKVEKRLASKKNVGKVSGSEPGPGSQLEEGQTVTLYQGVDAEGAKQTYMQKYSGMDSAELAGNSDVAAGQWCTKSGDCITLGHDDSYSDGGTSLEVTEGGADTKYSMTGEMLVSCDAVQQAFCSSKSADYLLTGDSGSFELFPHKAFTAYWCGDEIVLGGAPMSSYCSAGHVVEPEENGTHSSVESGGSYRMMDLFAVFPVGSDVKSVEDDGYFDASALAAAKKQKAVDTDRPFLMYRDVNQYKDSEKEQSVTENSINPFLPFNGHIGSRSSITKMKPAPSDETAYYLVEGTQPDWDSLEDANIKGVSAKSQKSNGKNASKNANTKKSDSQSDAATRSLMKSIAGKYGFASGSGGWGTTMTVASDGTFSGTYHDSDMGITGDDYPNGSVTISNFKGRFKDAKKNADGSYTMQCDKSALKIDGNIGDTYIKNGSKYTVADPYGIAPCGTFTVYPAGYDSSQLSEAIVGWSRAWYDSMPAKLETPIIVNAEDTNLGSESQQDAFFQSKYLE